MMMTGSYIIPLVVPSVVIAMLASYAALDLAESVTAASGWVRWLWLIGGAADGISDLVDALQRDAGLHHACAVGYDWPTELLSLLAAMLAYGVAPSIVSRRKMEAVQALTGSLIMARASRPCTTSAWPRCG
jgi:NO-binding membrane sensor protein with MHYT domain